MSNSQHNNDQQNIVKKSIPIVYEDEAICIVNKPVGIPVQGGSHIAICLTEILSKQLRTEIFPVHRLDKETSGLLVTAKSAAAARSCRALFESQAVEKEYLALCFGNFEHSVNKKTLKSSPKEGIIDMPIMENGTLKPASSAYKLLAGTDAYSLFSVRLHTGRMHQIRIHLAGIGCPIIGDDKHGNFALNKKLWKTARIKKLQLCAYCLRFPIGGMPRLFTIPIPEHIQAAIDMLIPETICSFS